MPINNIKNISEVMYMKINQITNKEVEAGRNVERNRVNNRERVEERAQVQPRLEQVENRTSNQEVRSEFSTKRLIETAVKESENMPEVREEKVAEIKRQIQEGTYNVSNREIARAMIAGLLNEIV